jgi:hypothetical protein
MLGGGFVMRRQNCARWLVLAVLTAGSGCDPYAGAPPISGSLEEANVKGTVRVDGKIVNNGFVLFEVANIRRPGILPRQVPIGKDGTYEVRTLVGENYVQINCKELFAPKMRILSGEVINLKVAPGENTIDLELPEKRQAPTK